MRGGAFADMIWLMIGGVVMALLFTQGAFAAIELEILRWVPGVTGRYATGILLVGVGGVIVGAAAAWFWRQLWGD